MARISAWEKGEQTGSLTVHVLSTTAGDGANPESKPSSRCVEPSEGLPSGQQFPGMVRCLDPHCHLTNQSIRLMSADWRTEHNSDREH